MVIGGGEDVSAVAVYKACDGVKSDALAGVPVCRLRPRFSLAWGLGSGLTLRLGPGCYGAWRILSSASATKRAMVHTLGHTKPRSVHHARSFTCTLPGPRLR